VAYHVFDFGSGPRTSHPSAVNNGGEVHAALPVLLSSAAGRPIPFFSSEMVRTAFIRRTVERRAAGDGRCSFGPVHRLVACEPQGRFPARE
jgi:hypothetical protein